MNQQEIFKKVATHLRSMEGPSVNEFGACVYRGPNGSMCAIGALIPDEFYKEAMEVHEISFVIENFSLPEIFSVENTKFLSDLQYAHDSFQDRENEEITWIEWVNLRLSELANQYHLEYKEQY